MPESERPSLLAWSNKAEPAPCARRRVCSEHHDGHSSPSESRTFLKTRSILDSEVSREHRSKTTKRSVRAAAVDVDKVQLTFPTQHLSRRY